MKAGVSLKYFLFNIYTDPEGSYICTCVDGYEGDGRGLYGCADINEW